MDSFSCSVSWMRCSSEAASSGRRGFFFCLARCCPRLCDACRRWRPVLLCGHARIRRSCREMRSGCDPALRSPDSRLCRGNTGREKPPGWSRRSHPALPRSLRWPGCRGDWSVHRGSENWASGASAGPVAGGCVRRRTDRRLIYRRRYARRETGRAVQKRLLHLWWQWP